MKLKTVELKCCTSAELLDDRVFGFCYFKYYKI